MTITKPSTYTISGLPRKIFGEAYVVISVWQPKKKEWIAEYNILTSHTKEKLNKGTVIFDVTDYPAELEAIDATYMEAEAVRQAQIDITEKAVAEGYNEANDSLVTLEKVAISPVTLWVRNCFPEELGEMCKKTESPDLKSYLTIVMGLKKVNVVR